MIETKVEKAKLVLKIDLWDLIGELSEEDKTNAIECLSCQDAVIKHVTDQILEGYTDNGWCGAYFTTSDEFEYLPALQKARIKIVESLSELSKKQIDILTIKNERLVERVKELESKLSYQSWEIYPERMGR